MRTDSNLHLIFEGRFALLMVVSKKFPKLTFFALVLAGLTGCGELNLSSGGTGSAEVYPGGDEARTLFVGQYYLVVPQDKCTKAGVAYRYKIEIGATKARLYGIECSSKPEGSELAFKDMSFTPYNTDFFLKASQVFMKRYQAPVLTDLPDIPEVFCRNTVKTSRDASDVVILRNKDGTKRVGRIYAGAKVNGTFNTTVSSDFSVSYEPSESGGASYRAENFELNLDSSVTFNHDVQIAGYLKTNLLESSFDSALARTYRCTYKPYAPAVP